MCLERGTSRLKAGAEDHEGWRCKLKADYFVFYNEKGDELLGRTIVS